MNKHFSKSHLPAQLRVSTLLLESWHKGAGVFVKFWLFAFVLLMVLLAYGFVFLVLFGLFGEPTAHLYDYLIKLSIEWMVTSSISPIVAGLIALCITAIAGLNVQHLSLTRYFNRFIWGQLLRLRLMVMCARELMGLLIVSLVLLANGHFTLYVVLQAQSSLWGVKLFFELCLLFAIPFVVHNKFTIPRAIKAAGQCLMKNGLVFFIALMMLWGAIAAIVWWGSAFQIALLVILCGYALPMTGLMIAIVYKHTQDSIESRNP